MAWGIAGAYSAMFGGSIDHAVSLVKRALALHPNSEDVRAAAGYTFIYSGEFVAALEQLHAGLRMAPFGPRVPRMRLGIAQASFYQRNFAETVAQADLIIPAISQNPPVWRFKAAALAHLGRIEEAHAAVKQLLALTPNASLMNPRMQPNLRHAWMAELMRDGLRKAGHPE